MTKILQRLLNVREPRRRTKIHCRRHKLELNIVSIPMAKACVHCGKSQPLRRAEIFWPALGPRNQARNRTWAHSLHILSRTYRPMIFAVLILGVVYLAWHKAPVFQSLDSSPRRSVDIQSLDVDARPQIDRLPVTTERKTTEARKIAQYVVVGPFEREDGNSEDERDASKPFLVPEHSTFEGSDKASRRRADFNFDDDDSENRNPAQLPSAASDEAPGARSLDVSTINIVKRVSKAISARAISGVEVSYVKPILYLRGEVKTQSQRLAAEHAARNVPGVKQIRSSIRVEWETNRG